MTAVGTQLINACKKNDVWLVLHLLGNPEAVKKAGYALRAALEHQSLECAKLVFPMATMRHRESALLECASRGYVKGVVFLVASNVLKADDYYALSCAAKLGHAGCVAAMLPHYPPKTLVLSSILNEAAYHGHVECIRLFTPVVDMVANNSVALAMAAGSGHIDCVKELLRVSDPLTDESYALTQALKCNHRDCIDVLYPVSDAPAVLQRLQATYPNQAFMWSDLEALVLEKERGGAQLKM